MRSSTHNRIVMATSLLFVSAAACAQPYPTANELGPRLACSQQETVLVGTLVYERDRGTPKADMIAKFATLPENDGTRMIAMDRLDDVYLDNRLTSRTIAGYRSIKCQRKLMLRDDSAFDDVIRERLYQCQAQATPGDRKFGACILEILAYTEEQMKKLENSRK